MKYPRHETIEILTPVINELLNTLRELESDNPENDMENNINYVVLSILDQVYSGGDNYRNQKDAMGILLTTALDFYGIGK